MIFGVSLGPGDPELITTKGLKVLQNADKIYYPGSLFSNGRKDSFSLSILKHYDLDTSKLEGFYLQMNLERVQANKIYEQTFQQIKKDEAKGFNIAIVSEGDLSTFSSFSYLLKKIKKADLDVTLIPGISSYALAAAQHQVPMCLQNETLLILPRIQTTEELEEALNHYDTVVLMKIISVMPVINAVLQKGNFSITYSERLGTPEQFTTTSIEAMNKRKIPYFSLITIRK